MTVFMNWNVVNLDFVYFNLFFVRGTLAVCAAAVLVVGFSVDYVVHLDHQYSSSTAT